MKQLQRLPEMSRKSMMVGDGWIRLEKGDEAAAFILRCAQQTDKLAHVAYEFFGGVLRKEGIHHLSSHLTCLPKETGKIGCSKLRPVLLVGVELPLLRWQSS